MTDKDKRSVPEPSGKESGHNAKEAQKLNLSGRSGLNNIPKPVNSLASMIRVNLIRRAQVLEPWKNSVKTCVDIFLRR